MDILFKKRRKRITIVEPCFDCGFVSKISRSMLDIEFLRSISVPKNFIEIYGKKEEIDNRLGLDDDSIIQQLTRIYGTKN
jgi:deoxyxylulose-5-phosphate synthase